jgi:hypothetical protein
VVERKIERVGEDKEVYRRIQMEKACLIEIGERVSVIAEAVRRSRSTDCTK